jgi:arabinofuranosyltransferase
VRKDGLVSSLDRPASRDLPRWAYGLALVTLAAIVVVGGRSLAFLCDDAFIHFRYAANAHAGHGLVWNAAPFAPVEGYGFLWVVLLWWTWELTGVEPPVAANWLSVGFGLVQFGLVAWAVRWIVDRDGQRVPNWVGVAALAVIVGNRTFLQWLSGGLDTALFSVWLLAWVLWAFSPRARQPAAPWWFVWAGFAAFAALTRPDGYPLVAATIGVAGWLVCRGRVGWRVVVVGLLPLLLVAAHVAWRRSFYGEWLPNTYFAKVVAAWPEAGWRYFACFALENGAWLWFPITAVWAVIEVARHGVFGTIGALLARVPAVAAVVVAVFNASYYLFKVGGDHFEYRVLSQTVPLGVLACVAMVARLGRAAWLPVATAMAFAVAGSPGWLHLAWTCDPAAQGLVAISPRVPGPFRPLAQWFDRQQFWLFFRYVGLRCNHHSARLATELLPRFPARVAVGSQGDDIPILAEGAVGVPSWCLTDVAMLDVLGLNDWVVARTPTPWQQAKSRNEIAALVAAADANRDERIDDAELRAVLQSVTGIRPVGPRAEFLLALCWAFCDTGADRRATYAEAVEIAMINDAPRRMAHERWPWPGYVEAFEPNVAVDPSGKVTVQPRAQPMTAERVRAIEAEWRRKVLAGELRR